MRIVKLAFFYCIFAYCLVTATVVCAECKDNSGTKLVSLQGTLSMDANKSGDWQPAQLNQVFCDGTLLRVDAFSRASILLPTGILLRMDSDTLLLLHNVKPENPPLLELIKGFVHFLSRTPKQLTLITPIANAGPEGTEFAVQVDTAKANLWVYEGEVRFYNDQGDLRLKPGQQAEAIVGQRPESKFDINPSDAVNWAIYYPSVLPMDESGGDVDIAKANSAYRHGDIRQAIAILDDLPAERRDARFFKTRAAILLANGKLALAKQDIEHTLTDHNNDADALALLTIIALAENHKQQAGELAQQAVTANPHSVAAFSALAYVEQAKFNLKGALQAADQATALASSDAMTWARKAELELANGLSAESEVSAQQALSLDANLERTQVVMGFIHLQQIKLAAAETNFTTAISLDSSSPLARLGLGLTKIRQGNLQEGRADIEIASTLDPNNSILRSYLGKAYYEEKRDSLAADELELAKQRDSKDPTPYFYDAIRKQTINRPIEALDDMLEAIEKNNNRAVYRSEFALDKDVSAREAGLGRIYNTLGFDDLANRTAAISLYSDPTNYSAHRLLSDSYANTPRQEIARASEYFQSEILQPLNYNPIQPSLAYSDLNVIRNVGPTDTSFNEYNRLFERNGVRLTSTAMGGSNNTYGDETALSGIANNWSYSLGQMHYASDGYRPNNGVKNNLYNAFAQTEITPQLNMQFEYRYRETNHGDLGMQGDPLTYDNTFNDRIIQNIYRYGIHYTPRQDSDLLFSFIHANRNEMLGLQGNYDNSNMDSNDFEGQYIYRNDWFNTIAGGGSNITNNQLSITDPSLLPCSYCGVTPYSTKQNFAYLYTNSRLADSLNLTAGLSYTNYQDNQAGSEIMRNSFNPKFGFIWNINNALKLRAAAFRIVKSSIIDNQTLEPIQIAGFNQFYDDWNGAVSWFHGAGLDGRIGKDVYTGVELHTRDLTVPWVLSPNQNYNAKEELYRWYFDWKPTSQVAVNTQLKFENYRTDGTSGYFPTFLETAYVPTEIRFFAQNGLFSTLKGTYVNQKAQSANSPLYINSAYIPLNVQQGDPFAYHDSFFLLDAAIGYRFPKQYGLISLEVKNILNKHFIYQDRQYQMNEYHMPDFLPTRMLFARFTFNY